MARTADPPTLADYVVTALSPALVMGLVGSLVFFLGAVLYTGPYAERLNWTLFFFVFGAVLVARIALQLDAARARVYGLALAGAVYVALLAYVGYPEGTALAPFGWLINLGLIAIVWWSADRLTRDCTHLDEQREASDVGLLEAAGLESLDESAGDEDAEAAVVEEEPVGFWERFRRYREARSRRPHTPGRWVVYFSLAALPLFGLGQVLIPAADAGRRRWAFWLLTAYVACGLGLLLTTAFLGLRRYLRQRRLAMPTAMTGMWLGLGGALVVGVVAVAALLPRPHAEYSLLTGWGLGGRERDASEYALKGGNEGKGSGRPIDKQVEDPDDTPTPGKKGDGGRAKSDQGPAGKSGGESGKGDAGEDKASGNKSDGGKAEGGSPRKPEEAPAGKSDGGKGSAGEKAGQPGERTAGASRSATPPASLPPGLEQAAGVLKWVVFAALGVAVIVVLLRAGLGWLANFSDWARNLLGWFRRPAADEAEGEVGVAEEMRRIPFAAFTDPFEDGSAAGRGVDELVRYTFAALEAWADERGLGRRPDETPGEFAARLGESTPDLAVGAGKLADWFARLNYAPGRLPAACRGELRELWRELVLAEVAEISE